MPNENRPTRPHENRPTQPDTGDKATDGAETDTHGNEFERAPGPGPKDRGKGAIGPDAHERTEGPGSRR